MAFDECFILFFNASSKFPDGSYFFIIFLFFAIVNLSFICFALLVALLILFDALPFTFVAPVLEFVLLLTFAAAFDCFADFTFVTPLLTTFPPIVNIAPVAACLIAASCPPLFLRASE